MDKSFLEKLQNPKGISDSYTPEKEESLYVQLTRDPSLFNQEDIIDLVRNQWKGQCVYEPLFNAIIEGRKNPKQLVEFLSNPSVQSIPLGKLLLGELYLNGVVDESGKTIVSQNLVEGEKFVREAADMDFSAAQFSLYKILKSKGESTNNLEIIDSAFKFLELAASGTNPLPAAQTELGIYYIEKVLDFPKGLSYLRDALSNGDTRAEIYLLTSQNANYYFQFYISSDQQLLDSVTEQLKDRKENLLKYANSGNIDALRGLGKIKVSLFEINEAISYFEKAAAKNDEESLYLLGGIYSKGELIPSDLTKAFQYYKKGFEIGSHLCSSEYGFFLANGLGCEKNETEANQILDKLVKENSPSAIYRKRHLILIKNQESKKTQEIEDDETTSKLLKQAVELNYPLSLFEYGVILLNSASNEQDQQQAIQYLVNASQRGCTEASIFLGSIQSEQHPKTALPFYMDAMTKGSLVSMSMAGFLTIICSGGNPQLLDYGKRLIQKGFDLGDAIASLKIGWMHFTGAGMTKDYASSAKYLKEALKRNPHLIEPYVLLHTIYYEGAKGIPSDKNLSYSHIFRAAELSNDPNLWHLVGKMLFLGEGVQKNIEKALELLKYTAEAGAHDSQVFLSEIYSKGENGVPKNEEESKKWKALSEKQG